jgi:hypothetical protein
MPPDEYRNEGTPSLSEGPDAGGEPFFAYFFLAFEKKVSRRKGETLSGRYRRNGYAHKVYPQKTTPISHNETRLRPLAPTPQPSNINQTENMSQSPSS